MNYSGRFQQRWIDKLLVVDTNITNTKHNKVFYETKDNDGCPLISLQKPEQIFGNCSATERSAGVTPEVNLRNPLHASKGVHIRL